MAEYWSYNDYTLPRLPVGWDMQKYPYAIILVIRSSASFRLMCHSVPLTVRNVDGEGFIGFEVGTNVYGFTYNIVNSDTGWVDNGDVSPVPSEDNVIWHYYTDVGDWVWCNHNILNESGSVVYAATVPVPIVPEEPEEPEEPEQPKFALRSWLTGYALGLTGKPLPFTTEQRKPVAYLYNGVRLPALPEYDAADYPYVFIDGPIEEKDGRVHYDFVIGKSELVEYVGQLTPHYLFMAETVGYHWWESVNGEDWTYGGEGNTVGAYVTKEVVWSNHDVRYNDGSLYISASDPVPVYE